MTDPEKNILGAMSSDKQKSREPEDQQEEWERILNQENGQSLSERKANQLEKLQQVVDSLHSHFGSNLIATVKKIRGDALKPGESQDLDNNPDKEELSDRVKGLLKEFYKDFYKSLEAVSGVAFSISEEPPEMNESTEQESETTDPGGATAESARTSKLPKGFNKWDLKMMKLHESRPAENKRLWVEFYSLKGLTGVGEILFNPTKDLYYFKPYDVSNQSFAVTDEHGRKVASQARSYYFRVAPNPPVAD